jgi:mannosylglycoprotein endo-beta-mannosidase
MEAFHAMWRGDCRSLHVANWALISLLSKHIYAVEVKDFRPISLIHSVAKLLAKVLSSRLALRMAQLIGPHQSAFIKGRCLHDNFQLVHSTTRRLNMLKAPAVMFKLNITKAFDIADSAFLLEVLSKMGFGPWWISLVVGLLNTASARVLVNRVAGDLIYNQHGLQQVGLCPCSLTRSWRYLTSRFRRRRQKVFSLTWTHVDSVINVCCRCGYLPQA